MPFKKFIRSITPSKDTFDINGDGVVDHKDFAEAAMRAASSAVPPKSMFDANNDGVIDHKDAIAGAKIAGAAVAGAGASLAAGACGGALIVAGTAKTIATGIAATAGAAVGGFVGTILGTKTATGFLAFKTASGAVVVISETVASVSPGLVGAFSSAGSAATAMNSAVVAKIAGLPVVEAIAVKVGVSKGALIVIAGVPIAREVAIAAGLVCLVVVGGYAYFLLNEGVTKEDVEKVAGSPTPT